MVFDRLLVVCDRLPSGDPGAPDRRLSSFFAELRHLWPGLSVTALAVDRDPADDGSAWLTGLGVDVAVIAGDLAAWMATRRLEYSLVVVTDGVVFDRALALVARFQPQAMTALIDTGSRQGRAGFADSLLSPEEARGAALVDAFEQVQPHAAVDALIVESIPGGPLPGTLSSKCYRFDGVYGRDAQPNVRRSGLVVVGRFAEEFGDPDEAGIRELLSLSDTTTSPVLAHARFALRRPPGGLRRAVAAVAAFADRPLLDEVASARAVVSLRPFGPPPTWLLQIARETATPLLHLGGWDLPGALRSTDVSSLMATAGRLLSDDDLWKQAQRQLMAADADVAASDARRGLVELLSAAGIAPPAEDRLTSPPAERSVPRPFTRILDEPAAFQGQVRTRGWDERRPMDPVLRRADVGLDHLWPLNGYAWWHGGHRLDPSTEAGIKQQAATFRYQPLISIVMPVHNTPPDVLEDTLGSLRAQLYRSWELCVADDASTSIETIAVLDRFAALDDRIRVQRLVDNVGIARASNAALAMATGPFVALLDHDDLLLPEALFEVVALLNEHPDLDFVYSDEDKLDEHGNLSTPFFKPSWSPDLHLCVNYVTHFAVYRRTVLEAVGGFREGLDGSQDYDLSLRVSEVTDRIGHVAKPIYTWRMVSGSAAVSHDAKPYALAAARRALSDALERRGFPGRVDEGLVPGTWRPRYLQGGTPTVSVLIPTRNGKAMLERCLDGLRDRTAYQALEVIVIDNGSDDPDTLSYLDELDARVVRYPYTFNYARQMNLAAAAASGELLLFLNNDMEILEPTWLDAMVEHGRRSEVGAVGARLLFPSGRPQHEGVFVGFGGGCAGNVDFGGYFGLGLLERDCTAVTAACMLMRPGVFQQVGGFEERLRVAFNDVDLCLRIRQRGYRIVYTPHAELVHAESASRGSLHPMEDEHFFVRRWGQPDELPDPFYNPNFDPVRPFRLIR